MEQGIEVTLQSNGGSQIVLGLMLLSEVGQGGFGVVFGARADRHLNPNFPAVPDEHPSVTDVFALKVSKQQPGKVHAFQSEADAYALMAAKLDLSVPAGVPCFYGLGAYAEAQQFQMRTLCKMYRHTQHMRSAQDGGIGAKMLLPIRMQHCT